MHHAPGPAPARVLRALAVCLLLPFQSVLAADLSIDVGVPRVVDTAALLARPDAATISVPMDPTFGRPMRYRAVPLRALLGGTGLPEGQELRLVASDGFVTNLAADLVFPPTGGGSVPWLAVEPPGAAWPATPEGNAPGPFYLVWLDPEASGILREQWPYAVATIALVPEASVRWPQLEVGEDAPLGATLTRQGQVLVATQCMVCHPVAGAGDAAVGPDLTLPYSPTEYFAPWALRAYVRDPAGLRSWPDMRMTGFPEDVLSDGDLDAVVAYLGYLAERRETGALVQPPASGAGAAVE